MKSILVECDITVQLQYYKYSRIYQMCKCISLFEIFVKFQTILADIAANEENR